MFKITIVDEQKPSVQSADRTKAVQAWSWGNLKTENIGRVIPSRGSTRGITVVGTKGQNFQSTMIAFCSI